MYSMGNTVSAFNWYRLAGEQGLAIAQHNVRVLYQFEKELNYDYKSAVKWYEMAGEQNFIPALHNLAMIYYHGNGGLLQNYQKSAELYQKATLLGDYSSQNRLSEMYTKGKGVDQNFQKALYWKKKSKVYLLKFNRFREPIQGPVFPMCFPACPLVLNPFSKKAFSTHLLVYFPLCFPLSFSFFAIP